MSRPLYQTFSDGRMLGPSTSQDVYITPIPRDALRGRVTMDGMDIQQVRTVDDRQQVRWRSEDTDWRWSPWCYRESIRTVRNESADCEYQTAQTVLGLTITRLRIS